MSLRPRHVKRRLRRMEDERRIVTGLQLLQAGWWGARVRRWPSWESLGYFACTNIDAIQRKRPLAVKGHLRLVAT